jgi:hypothetical protein
LWYTVHQREYDVIVKERDELKRDLQDSYEDCYKMQQDIEALKTELAQWKAKAQHRKVKPKTV